MPVIVSTIPFSDEQVAAITALPGVRFVHAPDRAALQAALPEAEILVGRPAAGDVAAAPRLRWVFAPSAGVDRLPLGELAAAGVRLTNARGLHADTMADHALLLLLALARNLATYVRQQDRGQWQARPVAELAGQRLLVAGFGAIGRAVALRARACGMRVIGLRRHPAPDPLAEAVVGPDDLLTALAGVDAVVCVLPLTPATRGLFDARAFAALRPGALFVNLGRGEVCDEAALVAALQQGRLGGAGLDVFSLEPLPPDHPLWRAPRTIITPHVGGHQRDSTAGLHRMFLGNLARYLRGEPLRNQVDLAAGY